MDSFIDDSASLNFVPANCPNCGGELRVPENRDIIKCMYCGTDIVLHDSRKVIIETQVDTTKLLLLAEEAEGGEIL